jgi:hypothetical protein
VKDMKLDAKKPGKFQSSSHFAFLLMVETA